MTLDRVRVRGRRLLALGVVALAAAIAVLVLGRLTGPATQPLPLSTVTTVALPGQVSRFDYADLDPAAHRLFIAHMGDGTLLELDTGTNAVTATVSDLPTVTGVLAGQFPDGLAYVPTTGQVWVSDGSGGAETVLDAQTGRTVATVPLGGEAGNVRYDPAGDRVRVAAQAANEIAVIDPRTRAITGRVPVPGCDHDHGLLVAAGRAFVGCDDNNKLVVMALPALLYVAAESGDVTTVDLRPPAGAVTGRAHLADNAHVVAVDAATGRAHFPVPDAGGGHPGLLITAPQEAGPR